MSSRLHVLARAMLVAKHVSDWLCRRLAGFASVLQTARVDASQEKENRVLKIIPSSRRIGAGPPERKGPPRHGVRRNIHCSAAKQASATSSRSSALRALKGRGSGPVSATMTGGRPTGIAVTRKTLLHGLSGSGRVGVKPLRA